MQPIHQNRPDPIQPIELGRFLGVSGLSWVARFFLIFLFNGLGWVQVIRFTNLPSLIQPAYI